ncbi:S41 family peptidase [Saccharicrinis aurantiacus]|uniref:S41 family peptidase n=1 Tax=Saccharicrinis aurantiacus TaxID=1849719 RepID=UPI000837FE93|nr:S41 family peptidase [Saccharicrinis aurantiacus]
MNLYKFSFLIILTIILFSCEKEDGISKETKGINKFVYDYMNQYYYWTEDMPSTNPMSQADSKEYFNSLLFSSIDKWSFITDDYQGLVDYFNGVQKDYGYSIRPYLWEQGSTKVVACVEFVYPNTPASDAGLKRGDVIININGEELSTDNYQELYSSNSIQLGFGRITEDNELQTLNEEVNLTAEVISINPILKSTIFEMRTGQTIGYLAYTSFIDNSDKDLEQLFANFKSAGIDELILDLRYNGGGSVATANLLASMIGPSDIEGKVFIRTDYNKYFKEYFDQNYPNDETVYIDRFEGSASNLDLSRLYVLTTPSTASASEMVMYTLSPYMDVIQIGEQTHGKYYGSVTLEDEERDHGWAIQPIVMRAENVDNSIDYAIGLKPDIEMQDDVFTYSELGSLDDNMVAVAINEITKESSTAELLKSTQKGRNVTTIDKPNSHPLQKDMHIVLPK